MPKGVYPRTANQLKAAVANLAKGRSPEARTKARATLRQIAADPAWRTKVRIATAVAMKARQVAQRASARMKGKPPAFRGGNGAPRTEFIETVTPGMVAAGFTPEYIIKTAGHGTAHKPPDHYKADFANPKIMRVVEFDGQSHRGQKRQEQDRRKTEVLEALGWKVIRLRHATAGKEEAARFVPVEES